MKTACVEVKVNGVWRGTSVANAEQAIEFQALFKAMGFEAEATLHPYLIVKPQDITFQTVCQRLFADELDF